MTKHVISILVLIAAVSMANSQTLSEVKAKLNSNSAQNTLAQGTHFILAAPPNYEGTTPINNFEIYVTSKSNTQVCLKNSDEVIVKCKDVIANEITTFSNKNMGEVDVNWEIQRNDIPTNKSFIVTSDYPISVYVLIAKAFTTDGYLALPVTSWGNEYHAITYKSMFWGNTPYPGGFVVIAEEDSTKVTLHFSPTSGPEYPRQVILNKNQAYLVHSNTTEIYADLSGTEIKANKRIGVIGYHSCAFVPKGIPYCDYLVEFIAPTQALGRKYVTIELDRKKDKGDIYQIVATEDNTTGKIEWFDMKTKDLLGSEVFSLNKGEIFTYNELVGTNCESPEKGVRGTVVIEASNPIGVMQLSASATWDCTDIGLDPFMFTLTAVEQFATTLIFQTASGPFIKRFLNLIVIGDPDNGLNNAELLGSIFMNGERLVDTHPEFLENRIPNTNLYWLRKSIENGAYVLEGETTMGGYVYGYSAYDSYGWPIAGLFDPIIETSIDYSKPELTIVKKEADKFEINIDDNVGNADKLAGLKSRPTLLKGSENFRLGNILKVEGEDYNKEELDKIYERMTVGLEVIDKDLPAKAIIGIGDASFMYNYSEITYEYSPTSNVNDDLKDEITIYPNPASKYIDITTTLEMQNVELKLIDLNGKIVMTLVNENIPNHKQVDISGIANGTYTLIISSNQGQFTQQLNVVK